MTPLSRLVSGRLSTSNHRHNPCPKPLPLSYVVRYIVCPTFWSGVWNLYSSLLFTECPLQYCPMHQCLKSLNPHVWPFSHIVDSNVIAYIGNSEGAILEITIHRCCVKLFGLLLRWVNGATKLGTASLLNKHIQVNGGVFLIMFAKVYKYNKTSKITQASFLDYRKIIMIGSTSNIWTLDLLHRSKNHT